MPISEESWPLASITPVIWIGVVMCPIVIVGPIGTRAIAVSALITARIGARM